MSAELGLKCDQARVAVATARHNAVEARGVADLAARDVADRLISDNRYDPLDLAVYVAAKAKAEEEQLAHIQARATYESAFQEWQESTTVGGAIIRMKEALENEKPPAVAPAEGDEATSPISGLGLVNMRLELDGKVFDAVVKGPERPKLDGLRTIEPVVLESDSRHRRDPEGQVIPGVGKAPDGLAFSAAEEIDDSDFEFPKVTVGHSESEGSVSDCVDESAHDASLSVDAPHCAVVSTPESTERDQTPTSSEKEMPSAVAPAEGDETKTNQ